MEIKIIQEDAGWYASYVTDAQGEALIRCQQLKIEQLTGIIETALGEIEMTEQPKEISHETAIHSIKALLSNIPKVEFAKGYFKWEG